MADATSRRTVPCSAPDLPISGPPDANQGGATHNDAVVPRTESRNHVEKANSMGTIAIDGYEVPETDEFDGPKPGIFGKREDSTRFDEDADEKDYSHIRHICEGVWWASKVQDVELNEATSE